MSADDEIRDMPALYSVPTDALIQGPTGVTIANDWADLLDGSIDNSLRDAGVIASDDFWFTGSNADGSVHEHTCEGWTTAAHSQVTRAKYGYTNQTDGDWLSVAGDGSHATCSITTLYHLVCIAW